MFEYGMDDADGMVGASDSGWEVTEAVGKTGSTGGVRARGEGATKEHSAVTVALVEAVVVDIEGSNLRSKRSN
jgi:hypothetical protein